MYVSERRARGWGKSSPILFPSPLALVLFLFSQVCTENMERPYGQSRNGISVKIFQETRHVILCTKQ